MSMTDEELKAYQKQASLNMQLCETLKEISRMAGTLVINGDMMEDVDLGKLLTTEGKELEKFARKLAKYLSK